MKFASSLTVAVVTCSVALFGALTACSSSDSAVNTSSSSSGGAGGSTASGLDFTKYVAAECSFYGKCAPQILSGFYGDQAGCVAAFSEAANKAKVLPGESVTQAQLDACAAKLASIADCNSGQSFAECRFAGTLADGAGCSQDEQCSGKLCVKDPAGDSTCGKCGKLGQENDACSGTQLCDDTQDLECVNGKCAKAIAQDGICTFAGAGCGTGLTCNNNKCEPALKENDPCDPDGDACGAPFQCDAVAHTCQPSKTVFVDLGQPCDGMTNACKASYCDLANTKTCIPFAKAGEACSAQTFNCGPTLDCDSAQGKCVDSLAPTCN